MGKITGVYNSDNFGNNIFQYGSGKIESINNDHSGSKENLRLVKNITLIFNNRIKLQVVIKIAPIYQTKEESKYIEYDTELGEVVLKNGYEHEAGIYKFFEEMRHKDTTVDRFVLKCHTAGTCDLNGNFKIKGELFNFIESKEIEKDIKNFRNSHLVSGYVYIVTEPMENILSVYEAKPLKETILIRFIQTTLDTLEHLYTKYNFCHWDYHDENTRFNSITGDVVIFDFDLSTTNRFNSSDYIHRISLVKKIIIQSCEEKHNEFTTELYQKHKSLIGHQWDLYMFLTSLNSKYNKTYLSAISSHITDFNFLLWHKKYIESLSTFKDIKKIVNLVKLPTISKGIDIFNYIDLYVAKIFNYFSVDILVGTLIKVVDEKVKDILDSDTLPKTIKRILIDKGEIINKFLNIYIEYFVEELVELYFKYGEKKMIELEDYDYLFFVAYNMFLELDSA